MNEQTIELYCSPGNPRLGGLYRGVIKDTGLEERQPVSVSFGEWRWDYNDIPEEEWKGVQPILRARITDLYNVGLIRFRGW